MNKLYQPTLLAARSYRHLSRRSFSTTPRLAADHVRVIEVGPRDGLQNEKTSISVETKVELVRRLSKTGLQAIEAGSFVAPKWVPQMASSDKILQSVLERTPDSPVPTTYQWLLPNIKGLENFFAVTDAHKQSGSSANSGSQTGYPTPPPSPSTDNGPALNTSSYDANAMPASTSGVDAMSKPRSSSTSSTSSTPSTYNGPALNTSSYDANAMPASTSGVDAMSKPRSPSTSSSSTSAPRHEVSIFLAATESFSKRNTNCTIAESLERFAPLMKSARDRSYPVRAYISVALGCPFEGPDTDPKKVADLAASLLEMGADEIAVADTTGMGTAPRTRELLRTLQAAGIRTEDLALHFHDTFGQALANTLVGLEHGVRTFDSAVGGLGGCPYSPGATGNVSTEDLVYMLHSLGVDTGVDLDEVSRIGGWITGELGKANESRAGKATLARLNR